MISDVLVKETIDYINEEGLQKTFQLLKGKDYELELLEQIALWPTLSWQDQVLIEYELHTMRQAEHGINTGGRPPVDGKEGWSQVDTARELKISIGKFSQDLALATSLLSNPTLRNIKDKRTALKFIKRTTSREIARAEALLPDNFTNSVLLGDSSELLKLVPSESFDVCVTDPPWSIYKEPELCADKQTKPVFMELFRVLKPNSFLYIFLPSIDYSEYDDYMRQIGFKTQAHPLVWHKKEMLSHGLTPWQYMRNYEFILLAVKGAPALASNTDLSSIFEYPILHPHKSIHPHEKPVELIKEILMQCSYEGNKILDPFAGSGATGEACKNLNRKYMIIERDPKRFALIEKRLNGA